MSNYFSFGISAPEISKTIASSKMSEASLS